MRQGKINVHFTFDYGRVYRELRGVPYEAKDPRNGRKPRTRLMLHKSYGSAFMGGIKYDVLEMCDYTITEFFGAQRIAGLSYMDYIKRLLFYVKGLSFVS